MKESRRARDILNRWREHCEEEHGASLDDYGMNVVRWHKSAFPSCEFRGAPMESTIRSDAKEA